MKQIIKMILLKNKWKNKKVCFGKKCQIAVDSSFEGYNRIGNASFFAGSMGIASYIGEQCHIVAEIGRFTCIASRVVTVRGSHPTKQWVSIHPAFYSIQNQSGITFAKEEKYTEIKPPIIIGNDVWIGDSAILMDGITIGDGAVIAAGAVVTKDVEPYAIVGGVPAKLIRYRFSEEERKALLNYMWWNRPIEWIQAHAKHYENVTDFLKEEETNVL